MSENPSPVVVRAKPKKSGKRKTKTKISEPNDQLSVEQKKTLAAFVKANTLLWSLQDPNHKKADKQIETWAKIALDMGVNGKNLLNHSFLIVQDNYANYQL